MTNMSNSYIFLSLSRRTCGQRAGRAMTLTGTPVERSVEDLAPLVAFSRGDGDLFGGVTLSSRMHHGISNLLGPVVFGSSVAPTSGGVPPLVQDTVRFDLSAVEAELHDHWLEQLRVALDAQGGFQAAAAAARLLTACRGAACDPAALSSRWVPDHLAARLPGRLGPLWDSEVPTRRRLVTDLVRAHGGQSLVFTDFPAAAHALSEHLCHSGVRSAAYTSRATAAARRTAVEEFHRGTLACLVLSGMARHGLNLQQAGLVVHYDVPASGSSYTQRVGRAARIGSPHAQVRVVTLSARGTVDEPLTDGLAELGGGDWLEAAAASVMPVVQQARRCVTALEQARRGP